MSTEHILDAIDGALAWDGGTDEMRWRPPEQEPPPKLAPPLRRRSSRVTIIIEDDDEVTVLDVPDPLDAEYSMDVREDPPHWQGLAHSFAPVRTETNIGLKMRVNPDEGFTTYRGREYVNTVLGRIAGEGE
ncbi:hypothetical protein ACFOY2_05200 [Nonomuraea purpurea]|uniref:Uncharacterized protein n=1 Tax=Nonomuraea purpurea TaxID=1849276 RepID=A0ABV8G1S4_9ACTN